MSDEKPKNIDEYKKWLKEEHKVELSDRTKTHYESVTNKVRKDLVESIFWNELTKNLKEFNGEYLSKKAGYPLLTGFESELFIKPFDSFLLKTFRKNILENERWPDKPEDGWILPNNWYSRINDIVRTLFIVKYLDGVEFLIDKIKSLCKKHNITCTVSLEAKEEGYYAAHLYAVQEFEIPRVTWDTERITTSAEIQITTQLQEVIRKLLHKYYEQRRKKVKAEEDIKWQWNYKSDEFAVNYLGHILHYVEGIVMEIREKQTKKEQLLSEFWKIYCEEDILKEIQEHGG